MSDMNHTSFKTAKELGIKQWERYELERLIPDLEAEKVDGFNMKYSHRCIAGTIYKRHYENNVFARIWGFIIWRPRVGRHKSYIALQENVVLSRLYTKWGFAPRNQKAAADAIRGFLTTGWY